MTYNPEHLKRWTMPSHYFGAEWPDYYSAGVGQSRDSDALEESNFACMLEALGGESETVIVVHESHWAVGWVEWIAIHQDNENALRIADEIKGRLADYPAVNEYHWSDLEYNRAADFWDSLSPRERVRMAQDKRRRYHWLQDKPVWPIGRLDWSGLCGLADSDAQIAPIARALDESIRYG